MKRAKWFGLLACGAVVMQASACVSDLSFYLVQTIATQVITALLAGAATGA